MGCYVNNMGAHEFNAFASHLDETKITPKLCVKACSSMGYNLASIEFGDKCFCKSGTIINSVQSSLDSNCMSLSCKGNTSLACASKDYFLGYKVIDEGFFKVIFKKFIFF